MYCQLPLLIIIVVQMVKDFGNCPPPELVAVENILFEGLANMAQGLKTSTEVLEDFVSRVSNIPLDGLDASVTGWLSTGKFF